jgi:hypothetical protein
LIKAIFTALPGWREYYLPQMLQLFIRSVSAGSDWHGVSRANQAMQCGCGAAAGIAQSESAHREKSAF